MKKTTIKISSAVLLSFSVLMVLSCCSSAEKRTQALPEITPKETETIAFPVEAENGKADEIIPDVKTTSEDENASLEQEATAAIGEKEEPVAERLPDITGYTVERQDYSVHSDNRDFYMFFDQVVFQGDDPAVAVVNQLIAEKAENYREEMVTSFPDMSEFLSESYPYSAPHYFEPRELVSVYYDEANISIGWHWDWYAGGVHNEGWESINLNRQTLEPLSVYDVLGKDAKEVIEQTLDERDYPEGRIYDVDRIVFFFDAEKVNVCFGSYELTGSGYWGYLLDISRDETLGD